MQKYQIFILLFVSLLVMILVSVLVRSPGYMDSAYYYGGGIRLSEKKGFTELIIWNFLDDPVGLPHPSHGYWMPLASILSAFTMTLFGQTSFFRGRVIFILLAILLPAFVYYFAYQLTKNNKQAFLAGCLAVFSGFYLPFLTITETFGLYMLFGGLLLLMLGNYKDVIINNNQNYWKRNFFVFVIGLLSGLMHLTRADGIIWLIVIVVILTWINWYYQGRRLRQFFMDIFIVLLGYISIMGGWFIRNYFVFHTVLAPGGSRAFWFTSYNDMFLFPASTITFERWWTSGVRAILEDRLWAFGKNLQTVFIVQGMIFLAPLVLVGMWYLRRDIRVIAGVLGWLLTFIVMTVFFPYAGVQGGFFHSGSAIQPLIWTLSIVGLAQFIEWGGKRRQWNYEQAWKVFSTGLILFSIVISALVFYKRVLVKDNATNVWQKTYKKYSEIETFLKMNEKNNDGVIMVTDPPGYFATNRRSAIVIPYGDEQVLFEVANRYLADFIVIDAEHIKELDRLYRNPESLSSFKYLAAIDGAKIFKLNK